MQRRAGHVVVAVAVALAATVACPSACRPGDTAPHGEAAATARQVPVANHRVPRSGGAAVADAEPGACPGPADVPCAEGCCPVGWTCGEDGGCAGPPGDAVCPSEAAVACAEHCCPSGSACTDDGGCVAVPDPQCPAAAPVHVRCSMGCSTDGLVIDGSGLGNALTLTTPAGCEPGWSGTGVAAHQPAYSPTTCVGREAVITSATSGFPTGNDPVTIQAWFRTSSTEQHVLFGYGTFPYRERTLFLGGGTDLRWPIPDDHPSQCRVTTPSVADGAWHFVTVTWDGATAALYVDGQLAGACAGEPALTTPAGTGFAIANRTMGCTPFQGTLDEVRVLDHAMAADQVARDFAAGALQAIPGTVGLWHFEGETDGCCPLGAACTARGCVRSLGGAGDGGDGGVADAAVPDAADPDAGAQDDGGAADAGAPGAADAGAVEEVTPVGVFCGNGQRCGGTCCPQGTVCAAGNTCVLPQAITPVCPLHLPVQCFPGSFVGACCGAGSTCLSHTTGVQQITCYRPNISSRAPPDGPACPTTPPGAGADAGVPPAAYCPGDHVCSGPGKCCKQDAPLRCGEHCCPAEVACTADGCGCTVGRVPCGDVCCDPGSRCVDGRCDPVACARGEFPVECSGQCCPGGSTCDEHADGGACGCPDAYPVECAAWCCLPGGACTGGTPPCACPAGRAVCGELCCDPGYTCRDGRCALPRSTTGGDADCRGYGERHCSGAGNAHQDADGQCHCCYRDPDGCIPCSQCPGGADLMCLGEVCVFRRGGNPAD